MTLFKVAANASMASDMIERTMADSYRINVIKSSIDKGIMRAQTAVEYLIILGVSIIITMVVVSVLSSSTSMAVGAKDSAMATQLRSLYPISITNWNVDGIGTWIEFHNKAPKLLRLESVFVNGNWIFVNKTIDADQSLTVLHIGAYEPTPARYEYPIVFNYTDMETSVSYAINNSDNEFKGTSSDGTANLNDPMLNGLTGFWRMDSVYTNPTGVLSPYGLENDLKDISGNNKHGAIKGGLTISTSGCMKFGCPVFNGANAYAQVPSFNTSSYTEMTYAFWVKPDVGDNLVETRDGTTLGAFDSFHANNQGGGTYVIHSVAWRGCLGGSPLSLDSGAYAYNVWHHVAYTWKNNDKAILYIDGVNVTQAAFTSHTCSANTVWIGINGYWQSYFADGNMDDLIIFNRALSAKEISNIYTATK